MEHNADLVCVRGLPDGNPGVLGRAAVVLVPHPWGAGLRHRSVWDASGAARQAAKPDADRWVLLDEDAGKWAARAPDVPAQADSAWADLRSADPEQSAALCKPAAAPSVERSFAVPELQDAAQSQAVVRVLAARLIVLR